MSILRKRSRSRDRGVDAARALRFEYCCGAECDDECRRKAMADEAMRMSPRLGLRVG
jgi:hypothetical protein